MARTLALTFDDGPNPDGTLRVLQRLERHDVRATFFIWGEQAQEYPDLLRALLDGGHSVQPHCWEHVSHWQRSPAAIAEDVDRVIALLRDNGVPQPTLWRPPYGHTRHGATREIAAQRGLALAGWTINPHDYAGHSAEDMLADVRSQLAGAEHAVLLLHDGHREPGQLRRRPDAGNTVELVAALLAERVGVFAPLSAGLDDSLQAGPGTG